MPEQEGYKDEQPIYYDLRGSFRIRRGHFELCTETNGKLNRIMLGLITETSHSYAANGLARSLARQGHNVCFVFNQRDLNEFPGLLPKPE